MIDRRQSLVLWFGVAAPPLAWACQLVFGWMLDEAACGRGTNGFDERLWQAVISSLAIAVAGVGTAAALSSFRAVREGAGDARGRSQFLAVTSLSADAVFLLLTILTLVGVMSVEGCRA